MLMTHTASVADGPVMDSIYNWNGDPTISLNDCITGYFQEGGIYYDPSQNFLPNQPGTVYEYSNMGTALEGYLVEVITGKSFKTVCQESIFSKLGMEHTHWFIEDYPDAGILASPHVGYTPIPNYGFADYPDGMLHSSIEDMSHMARAILQGGILNGERILEKTTLQSMFVVQFPSLDATQGLQFYQEQFYSSEGSKWLWGHGGGEKGIATEMYFDLSQNIGVVVLANGENEIAEVVDLLYTYALESN